MEMNYDKKNKLRNGNNANDTANKSSSWSVKEEYQLPFSETGYRSVIFDVGYEEKITKDNLKKWIVAEAYGQLGLKEGENPWEHAGIKSPVEIIKEVKFTKHDKD